MGNLRGLPRQGILIDGKKYKDGHNVFRKSKVDVVPPDTEHEQGVRIGVRVARNQEVTEFKVEAAEIHKLPRHHPSEAYLDKTDPAAGETWRVWTVPRNMLPDDLHGFKTTFRLSSPTGTQTVKWAVVYENQRFSGGYVIFGFADVGWNGAERRAAKARSADRRRTRAAKRSR